MSSKLRAIVDHILSELESINGDAGGYTYDLSGPGAVVMTGGAVPDMGRRAAVVDVIPIDISGKRGLRMGRWASSHRIEMLGWVKPTNRDRGEKVLAASDLLNDVMRKLQSDPTLGGNCRDVTLSALSVAGDSAEIEQFGVFVAVITAQSENDGGC